MREFRGAKYIYLLMGYDLAKRRGGTARVGTDNGMVGGQHYYRHFRIQEYNGKTILIETKTNAHLADFSRAYEVIPHKDRPTIREYIDEHGDNCSKHWTH